MQHCPGSPVAVPVPHHTAGGGAGANRSTPPARTGGAAVDEFACDLAADHEHDVYTVVYPGGETWTLTADTDDDAIATVRDIRPGGGDPIAVHATGHPN